MFSLFVFIIAHVFGVCVCMHISVFAYTSITTGTDY